MTHVCIIGVGLIGGSLGMALRGAKANKKRCFWVTGVGRSLESLREAKQAGAVDDYTQQAKNVVGRADMVVLCAPVQQTLPLSKSILPFLKPAAILTDVGSAKKTIVAGMRRLLRKRKDVSFVGAHPIAGSEKTGVRNAAPSLFKGAVCVLTPSGASLDVVKKVKDMWAWAGASCLSLSPEQHDTFLALTSHLPHLIAFSLFSIVEKAVQSKPVVRSLVAGSFRDMTRIAGADPDLWTGVLNQNRRHIIQAKRQFGKTLDSFLRASPQTLRRSLRYLSQSKRRW